MTDIFISYSHRDERFARRLAESLSQAGIDVWIDVDDIPVGMKWSTAIMQGLKLCQVMIVVISPDSMKSRNVEDEWQYFLDKKKPVVPVLVKPTEIHFQLNRIQRIDFYTEDYDTALQYLFLELESQGAKLATGTIVARPTIIGRRPDSLPTKKKPTRSGVRPPVLLALIFFIIAAGLLLALRLTGAGGGGTATLNPTTRQQTSIALEHPQSTTTATAIATVAESEVSATPSWTATPAQTDTANAAVPSDSPATQAVSVTLTLTTPTTSSTTVTVNARDPVNVRTGDDSALAKVGTLQRGQQADVLGINQSKSWYYVQFTDAVTGEVKRGWLSIPFVVTNGDPSSLTILTMSSAEALP